MSQLQQLTHKDMAVIIAINTVKKKIVRIYYCNTMVDFKLHFKHEHKNLAVL